MNSADDLDMARRDPVGHDVPTGIGSRDILRDVLGVEELDQ
jgi:hypothetical protein